MSYFRGDSYIWSDGENLHLWNRDGIDGWEGWCSDANEQRYPGYENASGVSIPQEVMNQFVLMRLAEILVNETPTAIEALLNRAAEVENFGAACLRHNAEALKAALVALSLSKPPAP